MSRADDTANLARSFEDDAPRVDLRAHGPEDWAALALFGLMALAVFVQFFSRYVMNDSVAWTEEVAIYLLLGVVFLGGAVCVRLDRHIHVDFLYRYLPPKLARACSTAVDLIRVLCFAYLLVLAIEYLDLVSHETMTAIDLPKSWPYTIAIAGMVMMLLRSIMIAYRNLRRGYSILERPELAYDSVEPKSEDA
ncbi:TRAP transporter small permease [Brucella anthropi]|uniref:TRAP transporter small permease n=1 Tax=Brucella anthropi TaxID=529 RepID=UPI001F439119|nr:TRAP transporter small permease [Brucella anthropi]